MNILVANNQLIKTGGTENYTYTLIKELIRRKHNVEYFTFHKGEIAEKIEALGVRFKSKRSYDLILANHNTTVDKLHLCGYTIQTCHGIFPELEQPSKNADAFVCISYEIQQHLKKKNINAFIINNGIDCERFYPQKSINKKITSVLSLCQSEEANNFIANCCSNQNITFTKINKYTDNLWELERYINEADLVVGIGRSLYDAMACGRAVISYDNRAYSSSIGDGYLKEENIEQSIKYNCSGRGFNKTFTMDSFINELNKYKYEDGIFFRDYALKNLNIKHSASQYLNLVPKYKLKLAKVEKGCRLTYHYIKRVLFKKG